MQIPTRKEYLSVNDKTSDPITSSRRRARQLRSIGVVGLLLGLGGAGVVYWTRPPDVSDDLAMVGYKRAETRQMEILYGKQGRLIEDLSNDLKQPGTQAILVIVVSVMIASGCFYFARRVNFDNETN
jgi:hypothetical protein